MSVPLRGPEDLAQNQQEENRPRAVGCDTTSLLRKLRRDPGQDETGLDERTGAECRALAAT